MNSSAGQAVSIDFTFALGVFIIVLLAGVFSITQQDFGLSGLEQKKQKASLVSDQLDDEAEITGRRSDLYVRGPVDTGKIPVDTGYVFHSDAYAGSGVMDISSDINITNSSVITVTGTGNVTHNMTYFFSNTSNVSYGNKIDTGSSWMNNTDVSAKVGSPGLSSLRIAGNELLNGTVDIDSGSSDFSVAEHQIHASTLGGDVKLYNGTDELIVEPGDATFELENLTTLYWYSDDSTTTLTGRDTTFKDGKTSGLTVAGDHGITLVGNLSAKVTKPDNETVKVDVNSSRLRIFLHDSGYETGKDRINFSEKGAVFFGAAEKVDGVWQPYIDDLEALSDDDFESRLNLEDWGYNVTLKGMERGEPIPLEQVVVVKSSTVEVGRDGNYSSIDRKVSLWR